ncbi:MAG: squalene/phytoene synthase family protein, partial [Desulfobacterales bacterium]|nr:squalene/phytoene synthase family protein [Desulfobacterales bacterium]
MTADSGTPRVSEYELQALRGVSRSFALTIPELPQKLRRIVTNAYLLCRIADTIEDEAGLSLAQKRRFFGELVGSVEGRLPADRLARTLHPRLSNCTLPAEKELVRNTARVIETISGFSDRQQAAIRRCLGVMT